MISFKSPWLRVSLLINTLLGIHCGANCQSVKPGLTGMCPSKWITMRYNNAPGREYASGSLPSQTFSQEEFYFKAWAPVLHKSNFTLLLGPSYRMEQFEIASKGENPLPQFSNWKLQTFTLDIKSLARIDSTSFLIFGVNSNKSGNINFKDTPLDFTLSAAYLKKRSQNLEYGAGFMLNRSYQSYSFLPVLVFNYNYSEKAGIEIGLPYKMAWRYNISKSDIIYLEAKGMSRRYYIHNADNDLTIFRRIEADMGIAYNRRINSIIGVELFGGYRRNLRCRVPEEITPIRKSGLTFQFELYIQPPKLGKKK
jgi:hypothetical protein